MVTDFANKFNEGILSKTLFLNSPETIAFIKWLGPFLSGEKSLMDLGYSYKNFEDLIHQCKWPKKNPEDFEKTYQRFASYREEFNTGNESMIRKNCFDVLDWGGVAATNKAKIKIQPSMKTFIENVIALANQDKIIAYDLNPNYINSGFTKIYTASDEKFIMYDGRVGSALCYLILNYLDTKENPQLPEELKFGYGIGRGNQERNPTINKQINIFPEITRDRNVHFISNIKANWLAEAIVKTHKLVAGDDAKNIFAFQSALFVLGEETPVAG